MYLDEYLFEESQVARKEVDKLVEWFFTAGFDRFFMTLPAVIFHQLDL